MFDDVDFLNPQIWPGFDPSHPRYCKMRDQTFNGLDETANIRDSNGLEIPMLAMMALHRAGGTTDVYWVNQVIEEIRDYAANPSNVDVIGFFFWVDPSISDTCGHAFFESLFAVNDWDFDCAVTNADLTLVSAAFAAFDPMVDFDRDGSVTNADLAYWVTNQLNPVVNYPCFIVPLCPCSSIPCTGPLAPCP